jgi:hypothetical protein
LDVNDSERPLQSRINDTSYQRLLQCLGWTAARSLIISPIDRDFGMLKVYTKASGRFLTAGDLRIVKSIGERIRNLAGPLAERAALHELNLAASKLAGLSGEELARQLVAELEAWTARYIKPGCQIYILAQTEAGVPMVATGSPGLRAFRPLRKHTPKANCRHHARAAGRLHCQSTTV